MATTATRKKTIYGPITTQPSSLTLYPFPFPLINLPSVPFLPELHFFYLLSPNPLPFTLNPTLSRTPTPHLIPPSTLLPYFHISITFPLPLPLVPSSLPPSSLPLPYSIPHPLPPYVHSLSLLPYPTLTLSRRTPIPSIFSLLLYPNASPLPPPKSPLRPPMHPSGRRRLISLD